MSVASSSGPQATPMFSMLHAENREEWPTGNEARISEGGENHEECMYKFYSLGYSREGNSLQISND